MASPVCLRLGTRCVDTATAPATIAIVALASGVAAAWPWLVLAPLVGGPLVALAAGSVGWLTARVAAPPSHANDNAPRAVSLAPHDGRGLQQPDARIMVGGYDNAPPRGGGGLPVVAAPGGLTIKGNVAPAA